MKFNEIIIEFLGPLFSTHGFKCIDSNTYGVTMASDRVTVYISKDPRESGFSLSVQLDNHEPVHLSSSIMDEFLQPRLKYITPSLTHEDDIRNIAIFFNGPGLALLYGNENLYARMEEFQKEESRIYTKGIHDSNWKNKADAAWTKKDYFAFLDAVKNLELDKLGPSYTLKYKYALKQTIK